MRDLGRDIIELKPYNKLQIKACNLVDGPETFPVEITLDDGTSTVLYRLDIIIDGGNTAPYFTGE